MRGERTGSESAVLRKHPSAVMEGGWEVRVEGGLQMEVGDGCSVHRNKLVSREKHRTTRGWGGGIRSSQDKRWGGRGGGGVKETEGVEGWGREIFKEQKKE